MLIEGEEVELSALQPPGPYFTVAGPGGMWAVCRAGDNDKLYEVIEGEIPWEDLAERMAAQFNRNLGHVGAKNLQSWKLEERFRPKYPQKN